MLSEFFQLQPIPADQIVGFYSPYLVILSYIVAVVASYVALDITSRMRDVGVTTLTSFFWLIGGSFAMGAGIWSMHFIGMLAFIMPMPMSYDVGWTALSMIIAIFASGIAFSLLRSKKIKLFYMILGGICLGFAIAAMHYVGMAAMEGMQIRYLPGLFFLSIIVAIVASEAALYLALKSSQGTIKHRFFLKLGSALVMGAAICGMHYTGMAAAIFTTKPFHMHVAEGMNPDFLAISIAFVAFIILSIAIGLSSFQAILNAKAAKIAHQAGMSEVASNVLHNVGNVLNSVNVSSAIMQKHLKNINLKDLDDVNKLIQEHQKDLGAFVTTDPHGSHLPSFLSHLALHWNNEFQLLKKELNLLDYNIQHINNIISAQQKLAGGTNFEELIAIEDLIEKALTLVSINFKRHHIVIKKDYEQLQPIYVDKSKLMQVLINLIRNAKESLVESNKDEKYIHLKTGLLNETTCFIEIVDNGLGIDMANKTKIFSHGFTTKKKGHGFGLHASSIAVDEMGGALEINSEGIGKGASFIIILPYKLQLPFLKREKSYG